MPRVSARFRRAVLRCAGRGETEQRAQPALGSPSTAGETRRGLRVSLTRDQSKMWSPRVRALAGAIALFGMPGCGAFKRVGECEAVIETVNTTLAELHPQVPDAGLDANAYA